jgi:hypothetical protein
MNFLLFAGMVDDQTVSRVHSNSVKKDVYFPYTLNNNYIQIWNL